MTASTHDQDIQELIEAISAAVRRLPPEYMGGIFFRAVRSGATQAHQGTCLASGGSLHPEPPVTGHEVVSDFVDLRAW